MNQAVFTIKDHSDKTKTLSYLHTNYSQTNFEGKLLVVTIKPFEKDKSNAQNFYIDLWMTQWIKHQGTDKDSEHLYFTKEILSTNL
ncbi:hypothetical protein F909_02612 [Acinetobacter sp. ANC 3929]|nr:hypothetical protein F909_02612 [Acinetobacter sp. ANC 3929]